MEQRVLLETQVLAKRMNNLLTEVMDYSRQLAEALDRNDQVSVRMLIGMRGEPIETLKLTEEALRQQCAALPDPKDSQRLSELVRGEGPVTAEETPLAEQIASNRRLLSQVLELDKVLNHKLAGDKSIYDQ